MWRSDEHAGALMKGGKGRCCGRVCGCSIILVLIILVSIIASFFREFLSGWGESGVSADEGEQFGSSLPMLRSMGSRRRLRAARSTCRRTGSC